VTRVVIMGRSKTLRRRIAHARTSAEDKQEGDVIRVRVVDTKTAPHDGDAASSGRGSVDTVGYSGSLAYCFSGLWTNSMVRIPMPPSTAP
jgi:hypothetical protein